MAAVWVVLGGCAPDLPAPRLDRLVPSRGWTGEETEVAVHGSRFYPEVQVAGDEAVGVDRTFSLSLGGEPALDLGDVRYLDFTELQARVPAGVAPGRYDLRLTSPDGDVVWLDDAFTVTETRADRIAVSTPDINLRVGEYASVVLQVQDPEGDDVAEDVPVTVTVQSESGRTESIDLRAGLDAQNIVSKAILEGTLGPGGRATLLVSSTDVDRLRVNVRGVGVDDYLVGTSAWIDFRPQKVAQVDLVPLIGGEPVVAGEEFDLWIRLLDDSGNRTDGELAWVSLMEDCPGIGGTFERHVAVEDELLVSEVYLTGATDGERCRTNSVRAVATLGATALTAQSSPLDVLPGDTASYDVRLGGSVVTVGADPLTLWVEARDAWGNQVRDHTATLALRDDRGGLDTLAGIGTGACGAFFDGAAVCTASPIVAATTVRVQAQDSTGMLGWSPVFAVEPGAPESLLVTMPPSPIAAGSAISVLVRGQDAYGNGVEAGLLGPNLPMFSDLAGPVTCGSGVLAANRGETRWPCQLTTSIEDDVLTVVATASGHTGVSSPFTVTNGPLAHVTVDTGGTTSLTAGDELDFSVQAEDAFGNPYLTAAVRTVDMLDTAGELSTQTVALSTAGQGIGTVRLTRAVPENRLRFLSGGTQLGISDPFEVLHGDHADYDVVIDGTWAAVDELWPVDIRAVDAWGNTAVDTDVSVSLTSVQGWGATDTVDIVAGEAAVDFLWTTPGVSDTLQVDDGTLLASSTVVDVVDFQCADPPAAALRLDGTAERVLCLVAGATPSVVASATTSAEGGGPLATFHLLDAAHDWARSTSATSALQWTEAGAYPVALLVVDSDGCGDLAEATAWVGANDGEPVGPVNVALDDANLSAASSGGTGSTTVSLSATDCAGDPAPGGSLLIRADVGTVQSGGTTVSATGSGLALALDAQGEATLTWSVAGEGVAGTATVRAGVSSGAAYGSASAAVVGDEIRPRVVDIEPVGLFLGDVDDVVVTFSEPLWASTVDTSRITLTDPSGLAVPLDNVSLSSTARVITATPTMPMNGTSGTWSLTVSSALRDDAGNRLDGQWTGAAASLTTRFGDVISSAPDLASCSPSSGTIRPDGDDGAGPEADSLTVAVAATATPVWWRLDVFDDNNTRVAQRVTPGTSSSTSVAWNGRGDDGLVVPNGDYDASVEALDADLVSGAHCAFSVRVDNLVRSPE